MNQPSACPSVPQPDKQSDQIAPPFDQKAPEPGPISDQTRFPSVQREAAYHRYLLGGLLAILAAVMFFMVKPFMAPIVLAATFATIFFPFYQWLAKRLWKRRSLAALLCCLMLIVGILIPMYLLGYFFANEAKDLYTTAGPKVKEFLGNDSTSNRLQALLPPAAQSLLARSGVDLTAVAKNAIANGAKWIGPFINKTSTGAIGLIANLFIMLFTMFFFFLDGEAFIKRIYRLSPLRPEYTKQLFSRFAQMSRATVKGTLVIGLIQGSLGCLVLLIFGVSSWMLWGLVMVALALIPFLGAWCVLIPAAIIQALQGHLWQGLGIFLCSVIVVSNIDNFLRPRIVGHDVNMHMLLVFFSSLGGIAMFGIVGFIVGPVLAALFMSVIEMYSVEFKEFLHRFETRTDMKAVS
jgi:predicted PurR-regulated permease PerM